MKREIEIVIAFNNIEDLVASNRVSQINQLPENQKYTDEQLNWYNDLIDSIYSVIEDYAGFNIIDSYQSSQSYSYYIEFEAVDKNGQSLGDFTIKFRISDHIEPHKHHHNTRAKQQAKRNHVTIFRSITVNGVTTNGLIDTVNLVTQICDGLLEGDLNVLDELTT